MLVFEEPSSSVGELNILIRLFLAHVQGTRCSGPPSTSATRIRRIADDRLFRPEEKVVGPSYTKASLNDRCAVGDSDWCL